MGNDDANPHGMQRPYIPHHLRSKQFVNHMPRTDLSNPSGASYDLNLYTDLPKAANHMHMGESYNEALT